MRVFGEFVPPKRLPKGNSGFAMFIRPLFLSGALNITLFSGLKMKVIPSVFVMFKGDI